jgi:hypothetical protein
MIINFLDIIHHYIFYLNQRFGGWTLSPFSGKKPALLGIINIANWRERLKLSTGPNRIGVLPENADSVVFETSFQIKITMMDNVHKVYHCFNIPRS